MGMAETFERRYPNGMSFADKKIEPCLFYKTNTRPTWIEAYLASYQNAEGNNVPSILFRGYGKGPSNVYEVYILIDSELVALFEIADAIEMGDLFEAFVRREKRRFQLKQDDENIVGKNFCMSEKDFRMTAYAFYKRMMENPITENRNAQGDFLHIDREYLQPAKQKKLWKIQRLMIDHHAKRNIGGKYEPAKKPWKIIIYNRTINTANQVRKCTPEEIRAATGVGKWFDVYLSPEDMVKLAHKVFEAVMALENDELIST